MAPAFPTLRQLIRENASHHLDLASFLMGEIEEVDVHACHRSVQRCAGRSVC